MNWGTSIAIFYIVFIVAMMTAVFTSRKHAPIMVSKSYYELDLQYQQRMQKKINAAALPKNLELSYEPDKRAVHLAFPTNMGVVTGQINVLCPSNPSADFSATIQPDSMGGMQVFIPNGFGALGRIEIDWSAGKQDFFQSSVLHIRS